MDKKEQLLNRAEVATLIGKSVSWINKEINPNYRHPEYNFPIGEKSKIGATRKWKRSTIEAWMYGKNEGS